MRLDLKVFLWLQNCTSKQDQFSHMQMQRNKSINSDTTKQNYTKGIQISPNQSKSMTQFMKPNTWAQNGGSGTNNKMKKIKPNLNQNKY